MKCVICKTGETKPDTATFRLNRIWPAMTESLLHEIAHALVGRKHNHDAEWKAKAREIGCTGERTHWL